MGTPLPARNVLCAGPRAQTLTYLPRRRRRVLFSPTISQQVTLPRAAVLLPALGQHRALILLPPGGGGEVKCKDSSAAKTKEGSVTASHHLSTPLQFTVKTRTALPSAISLSTAISPPQPQGCPPPAPRTARTGLPAHHLQLPWWGRSCKRGSAGLLGLPGRRLQHEYLPVSRRRVFFSVMLCWQDGSLQSCCSSASAGAASGVALHPMLAGREVSQDAVARLKQR